MHTAREPTDDDGVPDRTVGSHPPHRVAEFAPRHVGVWAATAPALAFTGDAVASATDQAVGLSSVVGLLVVGVITAACSVRVNASTALWIAVLGWLFVVGFVLNSYGELHVHGAEGWWPLAVLAFVAVVSSRATAHPRQGLREGRA
jgi:hypothetical protein